MPETKNKKAGRPKIGDSFRVTLPKDVVRWLKRKGNPNGKMSKKIREEITANYKNNMGHVVDIPSSSGTALTVTSMDLGNCSINVELPEQLRLALNVKATHININLAGQ